VREPVSAPADLDKSQDVEGQWKWKWGALPERKEVGETLTDAGSPHAHRKRLADLVDDDDSDHKVELSLCGHLLHGTPDQALHDEDVFNANIVSQQQLEADPSLWFHPSLVARFDQTPPYYPWKVAYPLLTSWIVFNRPISLSAVQNLMNTTVNVSKAPQSGSSWRGWFGRGVSRSDLPQQAPSAAHEAADTENSSPSAPLIPRKAKTVGADLEMGPMPPSPDTPVLQADGLQREAGAGLTPIPHAREVNGNGGPAGGAGSVLCCATPTPTTQGSPSKCYRKSLRPTTEQLRSLNLKPGPNPVTFSVTSSLQGTQSITSTIYFWPPNAKIVVSDVDGTITKSDLLGQLMPIVGRDWSHLGVASLYTAIRKNGYRIVYMSARAIGQADLTRDYLFGLCQSEMDRLPDGPLILSPDRLLSSFRREVIDRKPHVFKIAALRDIRGLFSQEHNPFYAGFGNRESDYRAYTSVGVPEAKVFIIDTKGLIHHCNTTYARTYQTMRQIVHEMFPSVRGGEEDAHAAAAGDDRDKDQGQESPSADDQVNTTTTTERRGGRGGGGGGRGAVSVSYAGWSREFDPAVERNMKARKTLA